MPAFDSPATLVARFLKANNYNETLDVFLEEAGLPPDTGTTGKNDLTLEKVLEEKKTFDLSLQFEKLGTDHGEMGWTLSAPATATTVPDLPSRSNLLHVSLASFIDQGLTKLNLLATTADRRLNILEMPSGTLDASLTTIHDSPILSCAVLVNKLMLSTSMSGQMVLSDLMGNVLDKRRDHTKYIVHITTFHDADGFWVATAGWDAKVHVYKIASSADAMPSNQIGAPSASITLSSNPESILFIPHPDSAQPILIVTRRDSTFLYYYTTEAEPRLLGRQNLAPHSNAWIAFTPSAIAISPTDSSLLAVATSAVPHMKLIIVRLMIPPINGETSAPVPVTSATAAVRASLLDEVDASAPTQASQAREALALQDREAAAILIHCTTLAPQTPYSTPALAWRPDGTGVWVNSDDGVVRGIETVSGKIVSTLRGHEPGSKIRCLCAGKVEKEDGSFEELLVSGGFDQKLVIWRPVSSQ